LLLLLLLALPPAPHRIAAVVLLMHRPNKAAALSTTTSTTLGAIAATRIPLLGATIVTRIVGLLRPATCTGFGTGKMRQPLTAPGQLVQLLQRDGSKSLVYCLGLGRPTITCLHPVVHN